MLKQILTVPDTADELGIDRETVTRWIKTGQLAATNVCKNAGGCKPRWRVRREDLDAFLATRSNRPAAKQTAPKRVKQPATCGRKWF